MSAFDSLVTGPDNSAYTVILAHGAGVGMDAPFMEAVAVGLAAEGIRCVRFEFPYMQLMRSTGTRRPPDRPEILRSRFMDVIREFGPPEHLVIGGKSMGGRVASVIADHAGVAGLVCLGYPFHPPGRPENLRTGHLTHIQTRALFLQGERDPFGVRQEVEGYQLSPSISVVFVPNGEHSFKPRKDSGFTIEGNMVLAVNEIVRFLGELG